MTSRLLVAARITSGDLHDHVVALAEATERLLSANSKRPIYRVEWFIDGEAVFAEPFIKNVSLRHMLTKKHKKDEVDYIVTSIAELMYTVAEDVYLLVHNEPDSLLSVLDEAICHPGRLLDGGTFAKSNGQRINEPINLCLIIEFEASEVSSDKASLHFFQKAVVRSGDYSEALRVLNDDLASLDCFLVRVRGWHKEVVGDMEDENLGYLGGRIYFKE